MEKQREVKKLGTNPVYAAALSFLMTGGGQIYNRQLKRFAAIWVAQFIMLFCMMTTFWLLIGFLFIIPMVGIWMFSIFDAYNEANKER